MKQSYGSKKRELGLSAGTLLLLAVACRSAAAQKCVSNAGAPLSTDRPQITNSSVVVPCGSLQLENGLEVSGNGSQAGADVPETSIRYGLLHKTELRLRCRITLAPTPCPLAWRAEPAMWSWA